MRRILIVVLLLSATAWAHPSVSVVIDSKGNVFYSDLKQVWRIDTQGNKSVAVSNVHSHELWLDAADNLYGEHLWYSGPQDGSGKWYHRVWKRAPDGRVSDAIPATQGFRTNFSFVHDAAGNGYMAGEGEGSRVRNYVRIIDTAGHSRVLAGGASGQRDGKGEAAGFADIRWMNVGADGNLYVIDGQNVRRVTREGVVTTLARNVTEHSPLQIAVGRQHDLMGLTADAAGNVYVAVYGARVIKKIGADGKVTVFERSTLPWSPTGLAFSGKTVYILEYSDPFAVRVRKLALK